MAQHQTPGVYIEKIPTFPPSIVPVETAIPAFIGYTQTDTDLVANDLHLKPTRIASLGEYEKLFGGAQPESNIAVAIAESQDSKGNTVSFNAVASLAETARSKHIMSYAVQMFFANGGGPCYIVSVDPYKALGTPLVEAELKAGLDTLVNVDEPTLIVFPEAQFLSIADFATLHDLALAQCELLKDRFVIMDVHGDAFSLSDPTSNLLAAVTSFRNKGIGANNLKYGAAYGPNIATVLDFAIDETAIDVAYSLNGGAATTAKLDTLAGSEHRRYELATAAIRDLACTLPPSSAIAGIYAAVDNSRGVWKAPANVSLAGVVKPTIEFSNVEQDQMNVDDTAGKSINAIRSFRDKGALVWGARTLAGNDNEWRYVSVHRFFIFVEESVKKATSHFVFEPNDANTWVKVQSMIENFLTTFWRQGALQGSKPEDAFYVAIGLGKTMTPLDILEGRMIIEIGMAAVRPAEFIVLRFRHTMTES